MNCRIREHSWISSSASHVRANEDTIPVNDVSIHKDMTSQDIAHLKYKINLVSPETDYYFQQLSVWRLLFGLIQQQVASINIQFLDDLCFLPGE